jgi:hypothetical protein
MKVNIAPLQPRGSVKEWFRDAFGGLGRPHLTQYDLATARWPSDYPEMKIVFISDLHVGCPAVTLPRLEKLVERINALEPDVILLGGDYLNEEGGPKGPYVAPKDMAPVLGKLKSKFHDGVIGVLGNHDAHDKAGVLNAFRGSGIIMLENGAHKIGHLEHPVYIAGLADHLTGVIDLQKTFEAVGGKGPVIMLEHNPSAFDKIREFSSKAILTLSGHTHAWQVKGPGREMLPLPGGTPSHYAEGLIEVGGEYLLVSSGLGTSGLPLRITCPAQIEQIVLKNG